MKKGFTLIEVMSVIILITLIFLLSFPLLLNTVNQTQNQIDSSKQALLKNAARDYIEDNSNKYSFTAGNVYCISVRSLVKENYVDQNIIQSKKNHLFNKMIMVSYGNHRQVNYKIVTHCGNEN